MVAIARCTVRLTFPSGDRAGTNTWHVRADSAPGGSSDVAQAMAAVETYYQGLAADAWSEGFSARWDGESTTTGGNPQIVPSATPWAVEGAGNGGSGPAGVGMVTSWRSSLASKRGRGRTFHCPLAPGVFDLDGTLTPTVRNNHITRAEALVAASVGGAGWELVVYSPTDDLGRAFISARVADRVAFLTSRRDL